MKTYSILRTLEDMHLSKLTLKGRVIDLGGHKSSSYFKVLRSELPIEVANFDSFNEGVHKLPSGADHVFDFEKPFPLRSEEFGTVLCINVLEHIYHYQNVLCESYRILVNGGHLYVSVPFFFNIHASPDDYFRYTKSALARMLEDAGFTDIEIIELGEGPCSAVFQNFGGSIPTMFLKIFLMKCAMGIDSFFSKFFQRYAKIGKRVPLGYFVSAKKLTTS